MDFCLQVVLNNATVETDNPDLRDRAYIYWRLLSTDPEVWFGKKKFWPYLFLETVTAFHFLFYLNIMEKKSAGVACADSLDMHLTEQLLFGFHAYTTVNISFSVDPLFRLD